MTDVTLTMSSACLSVPALVDSRANTSLIDYYLAEQLGAMTEHLPEPLLATAFDGRLMCTVTHQTSPIRLCFPDSHYKSLSFHLYFSTSHPLVLGYPWLIEHNPHIDWTSGQVIG